MRGPGDLHGGFLQEWLCFLPTPGGQTEAAGFPLWQFPFSLQLEQWAGETIRNSVNLGCFQSYRGPQGGVQCGMGGVRPLPSGHEASWLSTLVPGGHCHLHSRAGRKVPWVPLSIPVPATCRGNQEVASGGAVQASTLMIREGGWQIEKGLTSWEGGI